MEQTDIDQIRDTIAKCRAIKGLGTVATTVEAKLNIVFKEEAALQSKLNSDLASMKQYIPGARDKVAAATTMAIQTANAARQSVEARTNAAAGNSGNAIADAIESSGVNPTLRGMLQFFMHDIADTTFRGPDGWYRAYTDPDTNLPVPNAVERVGTDRMCEIVVDRLESEKVALALTTIAADQDAGPVAKAAAGAWLKRLVAPQSVFECLATNVEMVVNEHILPMTIDGHHVMLDMRDGSWVDSPEGLVVYPAVSASSDGESRALDALVAHHFQEHSEEADFYRAMGIAMFGYGIPNLPFLLGSGGSGKDMLMHLVSKSLNGRAVSINAEAITGRGDEVNDLARLYGTRLAYVSFESADTHSKNAYRSETLKSITSGGTNPIVVRPKFGRSSLSINYTGSLLLYGNAAPAFGASGDAEGINRRFAIIPMTRTLRGTGSKIPSGFVTWTDAIGACAGVFTYRCLDQFIRWHQEGQKGFDDSRLRIPERWRKLTEEALYKSSRYGFLRNVFIHDPDNGLPTGSVLEVMTIILDGLDLKVPRTRMVSILRDTLGASTAFPGLPAMTERDSRLPVTVSPDSLVQCMNATSELLARQILKAGGWDPEVAKRSKGLFTRMQTIEAFTIAETDINPDIALTPEEQSQYDTWLESQEEPY